MMPVPRASGLHWSPRWIPALLLAAGLLAYANTFTAPFVFDDLDTVVHNPHIRTLWPLWSAASAPQTMSWRPVFNLSLALNYAISGLRVWSYHAVNVGLHLLATLVFFGIVRRTLIGRRLQYAPQQARGLAAVTALVWMLHPLQTESVTYVTQRTELLMGVFLLLTLYGTIRAATSAASLRWSVVAVAACALGMASKETMVIAPLAILFYDWIFLSGSFGAVCRRRGGLYLGLASTCLIMPLLVSAHGSPIGAVMRFVTAHMSPWEYATTQCGVIAHYLRLAVWPAGLSIDYYDWPIASTVRDVGPSAILLLGLAVATFASLRRAPAAGFLGLWFFVTLAPSSSVFPIITEIAAERRMYLPLCALACLGVVGGWAVLSRIVTRDTVRGAIAVTLAMLMIGSLGALTIRRNAVYESERGLWQDAVARRPNNARAHHNLGQALRRQGRREAAAEHFVRALEATPAYPDAAIGLGTVLAELGRLQEAEVVLRDAVRRLPDVAEAQSNLGAVLAQQGKLREAEPYLRAALSSAPNSPQTYGNLGALLAQLGRFEEAARHFEWTLTLDPENRAARANLLRLREQRSGATRQGP